MRKHAIARAIAGARWNPRDGLIGSDQGLWLDPSDMSTMFVESGASPGTLTPASLNGFVGRILDKSGRGNHAYAPTDAARPLLSARYNLFTMTEDFSNAVWVKSVGDITVTPQPDSSWRLTFPAGARQFSQIVVNSAVCNLRIMVKSAGSGLDTARIIIGSVSRVTFTATNDWKEINASGVSVGSARCGFDTASTSTGLDIYIKFPDIRVASDGVNIPYQRVNTATDYDSDPTKFPRRINYAADQSHTVNFPSNLGSDCVIARASPGVSAVIAENQTVNTPLTLNTNHSGLVITSRDISVDEKARLDEYLDKKAIAK